MFRMAGFYTMEIRGRVGRAGFRVFTLHGRTARLATAGEGEGPRIGRYRVHLAEFEALAVPELRREDVELLVIDEIGRMECLSPAFVTAARAALAARVPVVGTVALSGGGFIAAAKGFPDVEVIDIGRDDRDRLPLEIVRRLGGEATPASGTTSARGPPR